MLKRFLKLCLTLTISIISLPLYASSQAILLKVNGAIGPATQDYIERGIQYAHDHNDALIILQLDTPGGLDTSMRGINKAILGSSVPVAAYVAPEGARAASAGTFILYASHIAAMAPGTNLGAAAPVHLGGIGASEEKAKKTSTMEKKVMNDAAAYIRSLAELRHRNVVWGEQAVREAVSLSADEALKINVIDVIAKDIPDLLKQINGRSISLLGVNKTLQTTALPIETVNADWRYQFLAIITDPSIAYILLLIGIYGLFFEFYNPGFILPGVVGGISLLLAMYALQWLPINYAGFALLLLGMVFMIAEVFISSFGVLGIGGVIAFAVGSIFLLDTGAPGFNIAWQLILVMTLLSAGFFIIVINLAIRSQRTKIVSGREAMLGSTGEVIECDQKKILVRIYGEIWQAQSKQTLQVGQKVRVTNVTGLLLTVEPEKK